MARKKSKKSSKKSPQLWQWVIVAGAAFLLYQGLQRYLDPERKAPEKKVAAVKTKPEKEKPAAVKPAAEPTPTPAPKATPAPTAGPLPKWSFENAARFLPADAYPDNYTAIQLNGSPSGLVAYAKTIPGKKPGPQGLTNTQPGLRVMHWDGKKYQSQDLDFDALKPALGGLKPVGLPQTERKAWIGNNASVFGAKLFLNDETRLLSGFIVVDDSGPRWAPLQGEDGKTGLAAFLQGTTAATTRKVNKRDIGGKPMIVVEKGSLDLSRPEAGYQWKVDAYAWNGKAFVFDKEVSAKLTKEKKSEM